MPHELAIPKRTFRPRRILTGSMGPAVHCTGAKRPLWRNHSGGESLHDVATAAIGTTPAPLQLQAFVGMFASTICC